MTSSVYDRSPALAAASLVGIAAPTFGAGFQFALSHLAIPPLLGKPQSFTTPVFAHIYRAGALVAVPLSALGFASASAAAYLSHGYPVTPYDSGSQDRLLSPRAAWIAAAVACISIPIFTAVFMAGDIKPLLQRADQFAAGTRASDTVTAADDQLVQGWLKSWRKFNFMRSSIMGTAAAFAAYAIFTAP
ncbi:uncharacterized protein B0I36DRAFT_153551 [Microdochium trichocladiopsis]|uniref:DUF1772-domain-containing protein n=1 Tax=Microdochium trichocladiopsis TaxID=1682393 RepID=A0A9P8Y047_9PEZI|nr:uncharacterized protein B0I36DRAFT_153551 [Microdochium trichocladiopsis]KAH7026075.1 hypothetical protein B0I36DRAFT_153551 [Microdochium trichocladiopsis]